MSQGATTVLEIPAETCSSAICWNPLATSGPHTKMTRFHDRPLNHPHYLAIVRCRAPTAYTFSGNHKMVAAGMSSRRLSEQPISIESHTESAARFCRLEILLTPMSMRSEGAEGDRAKGDSARYTTPTGRYYGAVGVLDIGVGR